MDPSNLRLDTYRRLSIELCEHRFVLTHPFADIPALELSPAMIEAQFHSIESPKQKLAQDTFGLTGSGQTVVIIDSGIAYDHSALGAGLGPEYRVVGGWDFTEENDADPYDDAPAGLHGTHVAGIIGSNDEQHPGLATDVDLVALRVFNDQGKGNFEWIEQALQWVATNIDTFEHPITTINLSLVTKWKGDDVPQWAILEDEFLALKEAGLFITVAAHICGWRVVGIAPAGAARSGGRAVPAQAAAAASLGRGSDGFSSRESGGGFGRRLDAVGRAAPGKRRGQLGHLQQPFGSRG